MTRKAFEKAISLDAEVDLETVAKVLEAMEDLVFEVVALEDSVKFSFGTISGFTREPRKVSGFFSVHDTVLSNSGWSVALMGKPKIDWSYKIKHTTPMPPREYFELPENRYTTKARNFRKDAGFPEIPEYEGLSEERIQQACAKADEEKYGELSPYRKCWIARHERCRQKLNAGFEYLLIAEDIEKQREAGVPEDEIVVRTKEEILKDEEKVWIKEKERRKKKYAMQKEQRLKEKEEKKKRNYKIT